MTENMRKEPELNELITVYEKYKHLDSVIMLPQKLNLDRDTGINGEGIFQLVAMDLWVAIKNAINR